MRNAFYTPKGPKPAAPYSQATIHNDMIFVSGQVSCDPASGELVLGSLKEETERTLTNLKIILEEAGSSLDNVLKVTAFLTDINNFAEFNEIYKSFFNEPYPARSCVEVAALAAGLKVEVEAIAFIE